MLVQFELQGESTLAFGVECDDTELAFVRRLVDAYENASHEADELTAMLHPVLVVKNDQGRRLGRPEPTLHDVDQDALVIQLKALEKLVWSPWTVFEVNRGADGFLHNGDTVPVIPLDIYSDGELVDGLSIGEVVDGLKNPLICAGVGIVQANPVTYADVRKAVTDWCRAVLDREDVEFTHWAKETS